MVNLPIRLHWRVILPIVILLPLIGFGRHYYLLWKSLPAHWRHNIVLHHSPEVLRPYVGPLVPSAESGGPPTFFKELAAAPWAGSWTTPTLVQPQYGLHSTDDHLVDQIATPAFLMLHIFSTSRRHSRLRRDLIREYNLLQAVPPAFRHLVEIKFILGLAKHMSDEEKETEEGRELAKEYEEEEERIQEEQTVHGDIIRLENLFNGENMNQGKSLEWMRHVGRGGREAQWVFKCDDDTFPLLPNLLDFLSRQDPSKPSYIGTSIGRWTGYHFYFEGMMYGFPWGVIKTMAAADLPQDFVHFNWDEDARTGDLMYSLPPIPACPVAAAEEHRPRGLYNRQPHPMHCVDEEVPFDQPPPSGWDGTPLSPDPRSGLMRLDFGRRLGGWDAWAIPKSANSIGWHSLKSDSDYVAAYYRAQRLFESAGKPYLWIPRKEFEAIAEHSASG